MRLPALVTLGLALGLLAASCSRAPEDATAADRPPRLDPDYTSLVIPPNIAPMNFRIEEEGRDFFVRISSDAAPPLEFSCPEGICRMDEGAWRRLLEANRGKSIHYDVHARDDKGEWLRYARVSNRVADEPIDAYIVYRQLFPNKKLSTVRGIFQRSLESFERSPIITLRDGEFVCFNCHTFHDHNPDRFIMHVRIKHSGMMLVKDGEIHKINTKQGPMFRPMAFAAWHPDGRHVAATLNMYSANFPSSEKQFYFQAVEKRGDLVVYDVENNTISTTAPVFENEYIETHPCFSHDGAYIYYVRCKDNPLLSQEDFADFKFDLMRVAYDAATDAWGVPETVAAYSEIGKSCAFPRPSPDGRYVLHVLSDKSTYPIHQKSSDLYLMDLESGEYQRLEAPNSDMAESYPRWSSNGRWFSLTSNRRDGMSTLPYFAYFDSTGRAHKAFVLPQEDPTFYDRFTDTYNVVEMVKSKVDIDSFEFAQAIKRPAVDARFPNPPAVDAYTGATWSPPRMDALVKAVSDSLRRLGQAQ